LASERTGRPRKFVKEMPRKPRELNGNEMNDDADPGLISNAFSFSQSSIGSIGVAIRELAILHQHQRERTPEEKHSR